MRRLLYLIPLLFLATPLFALDDVDRADRGRRTVLIVDDVIRMSKAGVNDEAIIAFVRKTREDFDVNADDLIAMTEAGVSKEVEKAVVDEAAARKNRVSDRDDRSDRSYLTPYPYYYDPFYPRYYYDPFWYGPRVSFGFGFSVGPRFGRHHGFRHRR